MHQLQVSLALPVPLDRVFAFFADAENLEAITPPELQTLIEDEVRYALPWQPAGRLAAPLVARQLARIFTYRQRRVRELLSAPAP